MATPPPRSPSAGGILIAIGAIAGAVIGLFAGQVTVGFLIGVSAGAAIALAMWLRDSRR